MKRLVFAFTAADRVGLLACVTRSLEEIKAQLQEVAIVTLSRYVTIMVEADVPEALEYDAAQEHLQATCRAYDVCVACKDPSNLPAGTVSRSNGIRPERYFVTLSGPDQPGMIRWLSHRTTAAGIDIHDIYACRKNDGSFIISLELVIPTPADAEMFEREIREWAGSFGAEVDWRHESDVFRPPANTREVFAEA